MTLYLAGPMTGFENHNYPAFREAAERFRDAGFQVLSPAELHPEAESILGSEAAYNREYYLCADLGLLVSCQGVAVLPGWRNSAGAVLEVHIALELGLPVINAETYERITPFNLWTAVKHHAGLRAIGQFEIKG